jgi:hypothetical protein
MIIQTLKSDTSYIKATITGFIVKDSVAKNRVVLRNTKGSQILSSSSGEVVTIRYDKKLLANIIKNDEI